jgi:hypothetical protein
MICTTAILEAFSNDPKNAWLFDSSGYWRDESPAVVDNIYLLIRHGSKIGKPKDYADVGTLKLWYEHVVGYCSMWEVNAAVLLGGFPLKKRNGWPRIVGLYQNPDTFSIGPTTIILRPIEPREIFAKLT